jgi:predicted nucleic acid-binding protein
MSLVVVDTSIWIGTLSSKGKKRLNPERLSEVATCWPIIQEITQGVRSDVHHKAVKSAFLAFPCLEPQMSADVFLAASDLFRSGRRRGITIRSSTDCLIAAICIKHKVPIFHIDRDFDRIAQYTDLQVADW